VNEREKIIAERVFHHGGSKEGNKGGESGRDVGGRKWARNKKGNLRLRILDRVSGHEVNTGGTRTIAAECSRRKARRRRGGLKGRKNTKKGPQEKKTNESLEWERQGELASHRKKLSRHNL